MPLDIPSLPPSGQTLRYVKATYQADSNTGTAGLHSLVSQQVPLGAFILGYSWLVTTPFHDLGTSTLTLGLQGGGQADPIDPVAVNQATDFAGGWSQVNDLGSYPLVLTVSGDGYDTGEMLIYLWYV